MENYMQFIKLCQIEKRRWLFVVSLVAFTHILCQFLLLPYGKALLSLLPGEDLKLEKSFQVERFVVFDETSALDASQVIVSHSEKAVSCRQGLSVEQSNGDMIKKSVNDTNTDTDEEFVELSELRNDDTDTAFMGKTLDERIVEPSVEISSQNTTSVLEKDDNISMIIPEIGDTITKSVNDTNTDTDGDFVDFSELRNDDTDIDIVKENGETGKTLDEHIVEISSENTTLVLEKDDNISMINLEIGSTVANNTYSGVEIRSIPNKKNHLNVLNNSSPSVNTTVKKKMRCEMPPKTVMTIYEMNRLLDRHRRKSRAMRPRWSSVRDHEIIAAKLQIEKAPTVKNDGELYGPLFRNVSKFKRSYDLMEQTLKIYIYKEGEKPIFHQPILKGLYASEGWFMKLLVGNKQFVVKDPQKAHLFYMPFSSRMLEYTLYVRGSHNRTNLRQYLKDYSEKIAAKYRFWNRTGGADHFLVACHDWAPYETRHHMEHCIKALCNADPTTGFKIGRDVSLPETYIRFARNPLKDLGGYPPSKRHILAFFAGNLHGYLRPILLNHWKFKDPDMKIFGPMPESKMSYIQHMKSSKYCICPKGYEVNSPRVVEAIFYECVPVIISDNFVPPFFDILNWESFSIIISEKDIPNLKEILISIPEKKYLDMQLAVKKVQRHFLWHAKPLKYDLFYMALHSVWYNRVYQFKPR